MIEIHAIPAFQDNYIWCLVNSEEKEAWAVDPGDAAPLENFLSSRALNLAGILITHHHPDHVGGLPQLLKQRDIPVYGPPQTVRKVTNPCVEGDSLSIWGQRFDVWEVPGHTLDHLAFVHLPPATTPGKALAHPLIFCGDTLFSAGCGRLFEGSPRQMLDSLKRISSLPGHTRIYCTHEYTLANLRFARAVLGDNYPPLEERISESESLRANGQKTLPVKVEAEQRYNPFLLCDGELVKTSVKRHSQLDLENEYDVFTQLRRWKDGFA